MAFYQHSFNFRNRKVLNATSCFPAPGRDRDASNLERLHEFNCNLLAVSLGGVWGGWRVSSGVTAWFCWSGLGGFFALFLLRYTDVSKLGASLFTQSSFKTLKCI